MMEYKTVTLMIDNPPEKAGNRVAICETVGLAWEEGHWAIYSPKIGPQWRGRGDSVNGAVLDYLSARLGLNGPVKDFIPDPAEVA